MGNVMSEPPKKSKNRSKKKPTSKPTSVPSGFQYYLNKQIGIGSDGTKIYEGDLGLRKIAVKSIEKNQKQKYEREIRILNVYERHQNLILMYDAKEQNDNFLIILERCECNLEELISINEPLEELISINPYIEPTLVSQKAASLKYSIPLLGKKDHLSQDYLYLMRDIIKGLSHLHKYDIVHGDLTPKNILIDISKRAKLCDMGQAMILEDDNVRSEGLGTKGWKAPEIVHGNVTRSADVFSLGLVMYFCATEGGHPFGGNSDNDYLESMINEPRNYPLNLMAVKNQEIRHLLSKLLVYSHLERPESGSLTKYPIFWPPMKRLQFLNDYYKEVKLLGSPRTVSELEFIKDLNNTVNLNSKRKWYCRLGKQLKGYILSNQVDRPDYLYDDGGAKPHQLIRFIRDFTEHIGDNLTYQRAVGNTTDLKVTENFFMRLFPTLVVQLYDFLRAEGWDQKPCLVGYYP